ncbi:MAG: hypothetical protein LUG62_03340 [Clostridiales bacterium]|nr:hypothetical protein [Clostridiales bacterium]
MNSRGKFSVEKMAAQVSANEELADEKLEGVSGGTDTTTTYPITVTFTNGQTIYNVRSALNSYSLDSSLIDSILSYMMKNCCEHHHEENVELNGKITITDETTWTVTCDGES